MKDDKKLSSILFNLRKEHKLSQKELAAKLNVSDKAISRWETDKSSPSLDMLLYISQTFDFSFSLLLKAKLESDNMDEKTAKKIMDEFNDVKKKNSKKIKFVSLIFLTIILVISVAFIFTATFNRFKVYKVGLENNQFIQNNGFYIETRIKDTLFLNDLKIKDVEVTKDDTVSVDIYYVKNDKEYIIQNFASLENISFTNYQSYIKIDDLSDYKDCLFLRVRIIDKNNNLQEYVSKLRFLVDFSNNKIFYKEDVEVDRNNKTINLTKEEIIKILKENDFKKMNSDFYVKETNNTKILYSDYLNNISYSYEKNKFSYRYTYFLNEDILKVSIFDDSNTEIENYEYNVRKKKVTKCIVGSCNNYRNALEVLEKEVLYLFKK